MPLSFDAHDQEPKVNMDDVAIVGLATRFPGDFSNTEKLWENLLRARCAVAPFPKERFNAEAFYHPDPEHGGTFAVKGGSFLSEDPAYFDGGFFNFVKSELLSIDPQQRLLLESIYHALENAGLPMEKVVGSATSVYVSGFNHDHRDAVHTDPEATARHTIAGVSNTFLSNRVSWFYDFQGQSMTIDTACSSSMIGVHLAVQSLRSGESEMAVISGVNIIEHPLETVNMSQYGVLGPDGISYSFDHRGNGYGRGEGVGSLVLKPVATAIRDGDTIRAVLRGTGANHNGRTQGISVPSARAQQKLIQDVYRNAGLPVEDTMFVEAHGTGTLVGDPIEAEAIATSFRSRKRKNPLYIGAIKSGIGHLEGGSGVAGIIKSVLILEHAVIPPNVNFEKVNPKINLKKLNIAFPLENVPWPSTGFRRISINSFGVGGTNAHCILDDAYHYLEERGISAHHNTRRAPPTEDELRSLVRVLEERDTDKVANDTASVNGHAGNSIQTSGINGTGGSRNTPKIFLLSAFDEEGIGRNAKTLAGYLKTRTQTYPHRSDETSFLTDLAFTLSDKRSVFPWRSYVLAASEAELAARLAKGSFTKPTRAKSPPNLAFVFTGQGAQHYAMGRVLMHYPVFMKSLQDASAFMEALGASWSLLDELQKSKEASRVDSPEIAHPSCAALQIALVDLLRSWNIMPSRVIGHSSGEIPAAYCAGKLSKESAWKAAFYRGQVSSRALSAQGSMVAVGLSPAKLTPYLEQVKSGRSGELIIACFNSPKNCTVSGDEELCDTLKVLLDADGVFARKLNVKNAYHSAHMSEVADEYLRLMGDMSDGSYFDTAYEILMFSTVSGRRVVKKKLDAQYWVSNLVSPVRFVEGLQSLCAGGAGTQKNSSETVSLEQATIDHILELGPHAALQSAIKEIVSQASDAKVEYFPTLHRNDEDLTTIMKSVGSLKVKGSAINLISVNTSPHHPKMLVDLPPYSFNHSSKVISESRLSKNLRFKEHPRHDLFGGRAIDSTADAPRWRHFVRLDENPWVKEHMVTNHYVYPGVGFVIMAIEAMRQLADPTAQIRAFNLKHISLKRALIVPDTKEGVETCLAITAAEESSVSTSAVWKTFHISSYDPVGDDWVVHCTGYISIDYGAATGPVDGGREAQAESRAWKEMLQEASTTCRSPLDFDKAYENLQTVGLSYGPLFRNLSQVQTSGTGSVTGLITIPDIASSMPKSFLRPHLIHPATMDAMLHLFLGAILDLTGRTSLEEPAVPTFIGSLWISGSLPAQAGHSFRGYGKASQVAFNKFACDINLWDGEDSCLRINAVELTPLDSGNTAGLQSRKLCHFPQWTPDVSLLESSSARRLAPPLGNVDYEVERYWVHRYQLATMLLVVDALSELEGVDPNSLTGHWNNYYGWMKHYESALKNNQIAYLTLDEFEAVSKKHELKDAVYREVAAHGPDGALAVRMGKNIVPAIKGEVEPLQLLTEDRLMDRVYDQLVHLGDLPVHFKAYLSALGNDRNGLNILEVGAGTGSSTAAILDVLAPQDAPDQPPRDSKVANYTFTDISAGFFENSKKRFKPWSNLMTFKTFNAELDAADQGFETGFYDLIVAGNVIHATADLRKTLWNLRSLLKPGGKLILQEGSRQEFLVLQISFGQLPGWWYSVEENRKWCPLISPAEWHVFLRDSGFSGVDVDMTSCQIRDFSSQSIIVSSAVEKTSPPQRLIIVTPNIARETAVASSLSGTIRGDSSLDITIVSSDALAHVDATNAVCISLLELEQAFLQRLDQESFMAIKKLLSRCAAVLWVTGDPVAEPAFNMVSGLMRAVRWERDLEAANLVSLAIAKPGPSDNTLVEVIARIYRHQFVQRVESNMNAEYMLRDGIVLTNRFMESEAGNGFLASKYSKSAPEKKKLSDVDHPIKLSTTSPGLLDKLEWVPDKIHADPLGDSEVAIDICAVGLNFRDLMIAMGEYKAFSLGNEAAGVVRNVGSSVTHLKPGDRVVFLCVYIDNGCLRTRCRLDKNFVVKIPDSLSFEIAAGLPCIYATVIYGLRDAARLSAGETVLIHAAAGGVGQAAIHYAQMVGADIYATVSTPEKRKLLVDRYGVREDHIFSSRDLSFVQGIKRCTNGRGVDVVLNSLAGEALRKSWDCIAPFGRFVEVGNKDAAEHGKVGLKPFLDNVTMTSVNLQTMTRHKPQLVGRLIEDTIQLYEKGKIKEVNPITVMDFSQVEEGLRLLQSGKGMGKYVFVPTADDVLPIVPDVLSPYQFQPDASYVMAGGLGGLGRSIARWMVSRGARNLIFLSRSGRITEPVEVMVKELKEKGCRVEIFTCDVSDRGRVRAVIDKCTASMPPIKGCMQGAMTLRDGMFENMSHSDWEAAVAPKVQGSWNLHELLPKDMDFFLMMSSLTGIFGNRSQANYAAGNTFQDSLAHYRNSIGLPASAIDLGNVLSVGFVAENKEYAKHTSVVPEVLREEEVHTMIEFLIDPCHASEKPHQLTFGFSTDAIYRERGLQRPSFLRFPMYTHMCSSTSTSNSQLTTAVGDNFSSYPVSTLLTASRSYSEAVTVVSNGIRNKIASMLSISVDTIDAENSIVSYGIDSLSAIEVRTWLVKDLGADIPFLTVVGTGSIGVVAEKVVGASKLVHFEKEKAL